MEGNNETNVESIHPLISVHNFEDNILGNQIYFHVIKLSESFHICVGTAAVMKNMAVAMQTKYNKGSASGSALFGDAGDTVSLNMAQKLGELTRALTGANPNDFTLKAHRRLGKIAWLRDNSSSVFERVSRRAQQVTGLYTAFRPRGSFGEDFQVVNYGIGGHYIPHHDYFKTKNAFSAAETYLKDSGDRAATFMIYLGDVSLGGATVFPDLGVGAPPVKNAALFWYNFNPDGLPDSRTLHGGCPVIIGQKWVANKWIHEISTAMTKTCCTSPWKPVNT